MTDMSVDASPEPQDGRIVTFYSFKGGTGRSMALANVAWILAASGRRVLVADWDLESPGLHRFFHPFVHEQELWDGPGIIDLIRSYEREAKKSDAHKREGLIKDLSKVQRYAFSLSWDFPGRGGLDFLSPGKMNRDYAAALSALDWDTFYHSLNGGEFLDALRADMKRNYDYTLIDSRTGLSDIADICTVHLPDVLVDCFTLSTQGIEGAAQVAREIKRLNRRRGIRLLPVPMRVDQAEKEKVEVGRLVAMRKFSGLPEGMSDAQRRDYWASVEVPYQAFYAYEETLAVFGDPPGLPGSLLAAFERLTTQITEDAVTGLPPMDEQRRERVKLEFTRSAPRLGELMVIEYLAEDQVWAEWIAGVLRDAGVETRYQRLDAGRPGLAAEAGPGGTRFSRTLIVVSAAYVARRRRLSLPTARPNLAAYVTPSPSLPEFSSAAAVFLSGVPEGEAIERLRRLFGLTSRPTDAMALSGSAAARIRYPGSEPLIFEVPARNAQFTGREDDLDRLREQLHDYGQGSAPPVALQGLGGVGKTQVALEYVHRFRTDYDVIWWLQCVDPAFVDAELLDLGDRLRNDLGLNVLSTVIAEDTRHVLNVLSRGEARWLLVFDNADQIDVVRALLPSGGHVLITSNNRGWADQGAQPLPVDVFTREESVAHLRQRVPSIALGEAEQIAGAVGDLPLAVATAGAWLAETSYTVSDYLGQLERQPHRALSVSKLADYPEPVSKAWDVSLNRLKDRSPAAARLFELCSVMAPQILLNLLYSQAMARLLQPLDPTLSERMVIGRIVQEINRLALIKLDPGAGQMIIHMLVQEVVRERMSAEERTVARRDVHSLLVAARPDEDVDDSATWDLYRQIWPHLEPSQAMSSTEEAVRQLYIDRVRYLWIRGDAERGRRIATDAEACWMAMQDAAPDQASADTLRKQLLQLRFNLGNILREQGKLAEARALNQKVLADQKLLLGDDHPHALMTAGSLAADLRAIGHYREALAMDRNTYPAWTALYGDDHRRTLSAANNLAVSLRLTGDSAAALSLDVDTADRRRATLGADDLWTLSSARSIVRDLLEAGEYLAAAAQMEGMYKTTADKFGKDSQAALDAQVLFGIALRSAGRPADAEEPFHAAYEALNRSPGPSSGDALACRLSHAANLLSLERFEDAAVEIREVLAEYERLRGPAHPHTLACQVNLAAALRFTGQQRDALKIVRGAAAGLAEVLGDEHPYSLAAMTAVGVLLADQDQLEEAERVEERTTETSTRALGPGHPDTLRCRANLLLTRQQRGDTTAAEERAATVGQLALLLGENHPSVKTLRGERRLMRSLDPQPF
jgi:tetratricopeptide (TPR) repeat protein